jgi:site-specific recombinase XerD/ribosomal protein L40E
MLHNLFIRKGKLYITFLNDLFIPFFVPRKKVIFLSKKNEKSIEDFINNCLIPERSDNQRTIDNYRESIRRVLNLIKKDYDKLTINDINNAFSKIDGVSKELIKTKFRVFLRYHKIDDIADKIKPKFSKFNEPIKTDEDILTPEEITKLASTPMKLRDRAIIELFLTSGCSRIELAKLKIGNLVVDETTIWVSIHHGKNSHNNRKHRKVPIVANNKIASALNPKNLLLWLDQHPYKEQYEKPLFYSDSRNNLGKALHPGTLNNILTEANEDSGIKRNISPHILRHTGATYDGIYLTEEQLNLKYGWKSGSKMAQRYCHQNVEHLNQKLKDLAGLTEDKIEKETVCPNCLEKNYINATRCKKCNHIFDRDELIRIAEEKEQKINEIENNQKSLQENLKILENQNINLTKEFVNLLNLLTDLFEKRPVEIERILYIYDNIVKDKKTWTKFEEELKRANTRELLKKENKKNSKKSLSEKK